MAIINMGSSGVVVSQSCVDKYALKVNDEIKFHINKASSSTKKKPVIFALCIEVGSSSVVLPALVMDGLHFDLLLGMNWLAVVIADIRPAKEKIRIRGQLVG